MFNKDKSLMRAVENNNLDKVSKLLEEDVDLNYMSGKKTLLIESLISAHYKITQLLLENGADPNKTSEPGHYPLEYVGGDATETFKLLLEHGADPSLIKSSNGFSLYNELLRTNGFKKMDILLDYDITFPDGKGPQEKYAVVKSLANDRKDELLKKALKKFQLPNKEKLEIFKECLGYSRDKSVEILLNEGVNLESLGNLNIYYIERLVSSNNSKIIKLLEDNKFDFNLVFEELIDNKKFSLVEKLSNMVPMPDDLRENYKKAEELNELEHKLDNDTTVSKSFNIEADKLIITKIFQFASEEILTVVRKSKRDGSDIDTSVRNFSDVTSKHEINKAYSDLIELGGNSPTWRPDIFQEKKAEPARGLVKPIKLSGVKQ